MKELDFLTSLNEHINSLGLYARSALSVLAESESLSVMALPGGAERVYMDGARDKDYNVQINAKSKNQANCMNALNAVAYSLENLYFLPSNNQSYEFDKFVLSGMPSYVSQDERGFFIWQLTVTAKITIYKGVA